MIPNVGKKESQIQTHNVIEYGSGLPPPFDKEYNIKNQQTTASSSQANSSC